MSDPARQFVAAFRFLALSLLLFVTACAVPSHNKNLAFSGNAAPDQARFVDAAFGGARPGLSHPAPEPVRRLVRFASKDADLYGGTSTIIEAALFRPLGNGPFPAVVALHDCAGLYGPTGEMMSHMRDWAERLVAQGYAVLMPDSFNPRGVPEMCGRDPDLIRPGAERARDVAAAMGWLQARSWVVPDRVGLIGWANGGTTAMTFATSDGALQRKPGQPDFRLIVAFYPNCLTLSHAPGWQTGLPMQILVGARDDWAPAKNCADLSNSIKAVGGQMDLVTYAGAHHDFDAPGMPLHLKAGLTTTSSGGAVIGTHPLARADALDRVLGILDRTLQN